VEEESAFLNIFLTFPIKALQR